MQEHAASAQDVKIQPAGMDAVWQPVAAPRGLALTVHGLTGDKDQRGKNSELALALADKGIASLRFEMRGRGRTPGYLTLRTMREDIELAATWLAARHGSLPGVVVARGEGAFASLAALGHDGRWHAMVFWGAILYPRTSRELQGDYHQYRERGTATLRLPDGQEFALTEEYFRVLDDLPSVHDCCRLGLQLSFIHAPNDDIAPITYVRDFVNRAPDVRRLMELELGPRRVHHAGAYVDEYVTDSLRALGP